MKLTNIKSKKSNKGITLIELTVVILVLLSLISVLFIGARAWLRGSDRAATALIIRNAQIGVRSHSNLLGLTTPPRGGTNDSYINLFTAANGVAPTGLMATEIFGADRFVDAPTVGTPPPHPANTTANPHVLQASVLGAGGSLENVPALGDIYLESDVDTEFFRPAGLQ